MDNMLAFILLVVVPWASLVAGDVTSRISVWRQPRAAVVRDTLYLDGGEMGNYSWDTSTSSYVASTLGTPDLQCSGIVYTLNFNRTFSVHDDFFTLFGNWTNGPVTANPPFRSGFMFADDYEFYTFGGIALYSAGRNADLLDDQIWKPDGPTPSVIENFQAGLDNTYTIPSDSEVSRYITHGAGVNIPSEYLGFYFSGLQSSSGGYLENYEPPPNEPSVMVNTMIQVNMTMMGSAEWAIVPLNSTLDGVVTQAQGRPGAQLAWIPVGPQGLLIALGGVTSLADAYQNQSASTSSSDSTFMTDLSIYDINGGQWYTQATSGGSPPQTADFCTVVAHENGTNSYQIYVYGGYDGDLTAEPYNSVWILSAPSFQWTNVTPTNSDAGRYGHVCAMPYPDQMLVVGGMGGNRFLPLADGKIVQVFDLNTLEWQDTYDPSKWSEYAIPAMIKSQGDPNQKASGMNEDLSGLFGQPYPIPITKWYPYKATSSNKDKWLAPVLGGVLGGVTVAVIGFLIWLFRRKKSGRSGRPSSSQPATSETQVTTAREGVDHWRRQVKSMASSGVIEIDSSDRSTVNNDPPQEPVEIAGSARAYLKLPQSPRSPNLSAAEVLPQSPQSGSVEVSGDPSLRQEMQDTSPRQRPLNHVPSMAQQPDYRFRNHPLFPLNVNDTMSVSESALTSGHGQVSSVGVDDGHATMMSHRAVPSGTDDINQFLYGRPPPLPPKQPIVIMSDVADLRHQPSTGRMPYEYIYPGDALPSPS